MEKPKIQLPLFQPKELGELPTGKAHVSHSEISLWEECGLRHKLVYIDKLDAFNGNEFTAYGHVLHSFSEHDFLGKAQKREDEWKQLDLFDKNPSEVTKQEKNLLIENAKKTLREELKKVNFEDKNADWENGLEKLLSSFPAWMDKEFPGWKPVAVEMPLFERIEGQKSNRYFKGYIDRIILAPKPPRKGSKPKDGPVEWEYHIIDLKTTGSTWSLEQRMDPMKKMQLVLYKHYFCKKMNIDIKQVKCSFVLCKRKGAKNGEHFERIDVSVGPETIQKALDKVNEMIGFVAKRFYKKNKNNCKFCTFKDDKVNCP